MLVKDRREWVSWCAVVLVLAAYVAVSNGVIAPKGAPYQILNILGAGLFLQRLLLDRKFFLQLRQAQCGRRTQELRVEQFAESRDQQGFSSRQFLRRFLVGRPERHALLCRLEGLPGRKDFRSGSIYGQDRGAFH